MRVRHKGRSELFGVRERTMADTWDSWAMACCADSDDQLIGVFPWPKAPNENDGVFPGRLSVRPVPPPPQTVTYDSNSCFILLEGSVLDRCVEGTIHCMCSRVGCVKQDSDSDCKRVEARAVINYSNEVN